MNSEELYKIMRDLRISEDVPPAATMYEAVERLRFLAESISVGGLIYRPPKRGAMRVNTYGMRDAKINRLYAIERAIYGGTHP